MSDVAIGRVVVAVPGLMAVTVFMIVAVGVVVSMRVTVPVLV